MTTTETTTTSKPSLPERLLHLGADFTRHRDTLNRISTLNGLNLTKAVAEHIPVTQALARGALDLRQKVDSASGLSRSREACCAAERLMQLANLAVLSADHLSTAAGLSYNAVCHHSYLGKAENHISLAQQLTSLGAEDCLTAAGLLAPQMRRRNLIPAQRPPALTAAQHAALRSVAAGRVLISQAVGKPLVEPGQERLTNTTIRSLESRGLVSRRHAAFPPGFTRLCLTEDGSRTLAAALGQPRSAPPTTSRPAVRPTVARSAAR
ncbi:hypothetical protein GCM10010095_61160 [Streptomyces anthocyanicus]|uniref:hypothetical protein n=1 Tax=Streptomyces anthocyanicus TaxID=68174 RepID=UPI001670B04A|nr:hypothetical protein [Streptomyces anthocyanicus]GGL68033.1 hypothetical protein GCM10010095_61160 [Streptomyces anthocyanicus]